MKLKLEFPFNQDNKMQASNAIAQGREHSERPSGADGSAA